jgi:hypothetical protein
MILTCTSGARLNLAKKDEGGLVPSEVALEEGTPVEVLRAMWSMLVSLANL